MAWSITCFEVTMAKVDIAMIELNPLILNYSLNKIEL